MNFGRFDMINAKSADPARGPNNKQESPASRNALLNLLLLERRHRAGGITVHRRIQCPIVLIVSLV
jgi:hypothetical protein